MVQHLTQVVLDQVESLGYKVKGEIDRQQVAYTAIDKVTGERFIARSQVGDDYGAACALAEMVGIELDDG